MDDGWRHAMANDERTVWHCAGLTNPGDWKEYTGSIGSRRRVESVSYNGCRSNMEFRVDSRQCPHHDIRRLTLRMGCRRAPDRLQSIYWSCGADDRRGCYME